MLILATQHCRLGQVKVSAMGKMQMCECGCRMWTMRPVLMRIVMLIIIVTLTRTLPEL